MDKNTEEMMKALAGLTGAASPLTANFTMMNRLLKHHLENQLKLQGLSDKEIKLIQARIKADEEYAEKIAQRTKGISDGGQKLVSTLIDTAKNLGSMANSVASSDQSFTALSPVVGMIGGVAKGVTEALGKMASGIPVVGGIAEGAAKLVGVGIDIVQSAMQQQLEGAQKLVNSYSAISKSGASFGGNLDGLVDAAGKAGISIDTFTKFTTKNAENLSMLGGSVTEGAQKIAGLGRTIGEGDKKLLAMYGNYEELNSGIADFAAQQARYGKNVNTQSADFKQGAQDYLYNMRELSDITGQSVDSLKKQEEERAKSAAYQFAMKNKTDDEVNNINRAFAIANLEGGKAANDYLQEYIATNGHVASQASLRFASQFPAMANSLKHLSDTSNQTVAQFKDSSAEYIKANQGRIDAEVDGTKGQAILSAQGVKQNDLINQNVQVAADHLKNHTRIAELDKTVTDQREAQAKPISDQTKLFADSINSLEGFKKKMDELTMGNMAKMPAIMDGLYRVAGLSAGALSDMDKAIDGMVTAMANAIDALNGKSGASSGPSWWDKTKGAAAGALKMGAIGGAGGAAMGAIAGGAMAVPVGIVGAIGGAAIGAYQGWTGTTGPAAGGAAGGGGGGAVPGGAGAGGPISLDRIRELIAGVESGGDYNKLVGGKTANLTGMTLAEVYKFQDQMLHSGFVSSAIGKYQFIKSTLAGLATELGLGPDTKFTADVQDKLANQLIKKQGFDAAASGKMSKQDFLHRLATQWAGLPGSPAGGLYDGATNKAGISWESALAKMAKGGITDGMSIAGEAGPEAVIPLPDGRRVPVKMDIGDLLEKFDEMIAILKDHKDISSKHLKVAS
jgi:muramidase (phage lysozyme)